jgi:chromosome segregation ATPase
LSIVPEKELKKHKDEVEELNFELTKKEYEIKDQVQTNETLKQDLTEKTKLITENEKITKSKDELIKSQNVNLSIVENKLKTIETQKSDLEIRLNDSIVKFKTAEEETDMLVTIIESIFSKKKDKFERDIKYISGEYKDRIERAVKNVPKWFK